MCCDAPCRASARALPRCWRPWMQALAQGRVDLRVLPDRRGQLTEPVLRVPVLVSCRVPHAVRCLPAVFTVLFCVTVPKYPAVAGSWREVEPVESCFKDPGEKWEQRNDVRCVVFWPDPRAGARIIRYQEFILLHGGYRTFFPYPHSNARGAGSGTAALSSDGFSPYPTYPFYLDDLWRYNLSACCPLCAAGAVCAAAGSGWVGVPSLWVLGVVLCQGC